jgi:hypothetical protein
MESKPEGRRSVGRPKLKWLDGVLEDLRKLEVKDLVDGCQGQGILEESSSGSRSSYWAVALIMMMISRNVNY